MADIGKLERVALRELWKHEERGFSAWLERNLDSLSEAIGVSLQDPQRELSAGKFQVDLVAENEEGERVIVENQLEATDHNHLGQILTYAAGLDARTVIWVAQTFRDQHRAAIDWLNQATADGFNFFAVEIELYRIGESAYAPDLPR